MFFVLAFISYKLVKGNKIQTTNYVFKTLFKLLDTAVVSISEFGIKVE